MATPIRPLSQGGGMFVDCSCWKRRPRSQLKAMAAGALAPEFPLEDVQALKAKLGSPEQFAVDFDYLVRTLTRR